MPTAVVLDKMKMLINKREKGEAYDKIKSFCLTEETILGAVGPGMVLRLGTCRHQLAGRVSSVPVQYGGCGTCHQVLQKPIVRAASLVGKDTEGQMAAPGEQFFFS